MLIPPWAYNTILDEIHSSGSNYSTLFDLLETHNLGSTLNSTEGPWTLFAPDNQAFAEVGNLSSYSSDEISQILNAHLFSGNLPLDKFVTNPNSDVSARFDVITVGNEVYVDGALIIAGNNLAANGIVHAVDKVLIPSNFNSPQSTTSDATTQLGLSVLHWTLSLFVTVIWMSATVMS